MSHLQAKQIPRICLGEQIGRVDLPRDLEDDNMPFLVPLLQPVAFVPAADVPFVKSLFALLDKMENGEKMNFFTLSEELGQLHQMSYHYFW